MSGWHLTVYKVGAVQSLQALLSQELKHCWESWHIKPTWAAELHFGCSVTWSHQQQLTWEKTEVVCPPFWQLGRRSWESQRKLHEPADQDVPFLSQTKKRMYYNTGIRRQLSTASGSTFHIFKFAGLMKQKASLWCGAGQHRGHIQDKYHSLQTLAWLTLRSL